MLFGVFRQQSYVRMIMLNIRSLSKVTLLCEDIFAAKGVLLLLIIVYLFYLIIRQPTQFGYLKTPV